ncbi:MAG: hypothetical protein E7476_09115 [Ruminococcaceae bacterium]|nr:hypothetical protein [Oscillospiraceae bacterium]
MKKRLSLLIILCLLTACISGCAGGNGTSLSSAPASEGTSNAQPAQQNEVASENTPVGEPVKIRVAAMPQQLSLPMYYISQQGWDVKNGFKLELSTFQSGAPMNEALGADLWDIATIGAAGVLSCSVYDAVHIMSHEDSSAGIDFMVRPDSPVAQIKGYLPEYPDMYGDPDTIKGAVFMFPIGSGHHLLLTEYLNAMGLSESDISMVNMNHAEGYQAFVSGQGDFSATAYPTTDNYIKEGYVSAVNMNSANCPYYDNVVANRKFYDKPENQDALVALLTQMLRCADAFQDDQVLLDAMVDWYKVNGQEVNPDDVRNQVLERPFLTVADYTSSDTTASFKRMAEFFASTEQISQEDLERVFNNIRPELLEKALEAYNSK